VSVIAAAVQLMLSEGIPHDKIVEAIGRMEDETIRMLQRSAFSADEQAERRRAADRERKKAERLRKSAEVCGMSADTPSLPPAPLSLPPDPLPNPPLPPNPTPNLVPGKPGRVLKFRKPEYPPEFQMLWDVFPKHPNASKSEALRRWEQLDPGDRDNCLTGAMRYEDFLAAERRKRPDYPGLHLATFVHQRRWEAHLEAAE
jgi:hypothetical protein